MTTATREAEKIVNDRARARRQQEIDQEARRIENERRRAADREARDARLRARREAEAMVRASVEATKVVVSLAGVVVTAHPERSAEPVRRRQCMDAVRDTLGLFQTYFDRRVAAVVAETLGKSAPEAAWTRDYLLGRVRDVCRHAVAANVVTVEVAQ
jgi:hypothetical protein